MRRPSRVRVYCASGFQCDAIVKSLLDGEAHVRALVRDLARAAPLAAGAGRQAAHRPVLHASWEDGSLGGPAGLSAEARGSPSGWP